ncbi:MAG TPA: zinc ABC transporter substrate-binding protein [Candidatus Saccharimonadales bacterium]|nr:zinc ABC transporter substrate-binding protein [Candidatus Saccharimonadales bacterium]
MKIIYKLLLLATLIVVVALVIFSISRQTNAQITATFYPVYEFAKQIAGGKATVQNITPAGAEPHDFEPSPQSLASTQNSKVFIFNGVNFEPWLGGFLPDYKGIAVRSSLNVPLLQTDSGQDDPHFWLDPILAKQMVDDILAGIIAFDPVNQDYYLTNATSYKAELDKLDQDFTQGLATCQTRTVVTSHESFNYLAKRYNLNIVSIAGISPDEEPSPAKLAQISDVVKQQDVSYIFLENLISSRLADTIARETGAKTAVLDPIEGLTDEDQRNGKNYLSIQRQNLANLRQALACQ